MKTSGKIHQLTDDEFAEVRAGAEEVLAHARGKKITLRTRSVSLPRKSLAFSPARIRSIRSPLNVSQPIFAKLLYVTKDTAAKWEQGVRKPSGSALRLLEIAERRPEVLVEG
jgi:putative transcriptional regulator